MSRPTSVVVLQGLMFVLCCRTSIGGISRQSMSSGYQTMDFEEIQGNGDEEKEEEE